MGIIMNGKIFSARAFLFVKEIEDKRAKIFGEISVGRSCEHQQDQKLISNWNSS